MAAGLFAATTFASAPARAQQSEQIKPYVLVIVDISGSMAGSTGDGPSSCGGADTRLDHAKCALQQVVNAHADIQFGLSRFRATPDSSDSCTVCESGTAIDCSNCDNGDGDGCTATMDSPDRFQLLVPFVADANDYIHDWVDFSCGSGGCSLDPADNPDLRAPGGNSYTPIGGSLRGARRFFQGTDTNITANGVDNLDAIYGSGIEDPIGNDPYAGDFVAPGEQCRPYVVVLLTDGEETCEVFDRTNSTDDTVGAAAALLATPYGGNDYRIEVKPIGFGISAPNDEIEALAWAGGEPDGNGEEGYYADSEADLIAAFNDIIVDSIKVEICDGLDNDCDGDVDEGYQLYCDVDGGVTTASLCSNPGDDCDGMDDNCVSGTLDEVTNACGLCGALPTEVCNLSDDDCDGLVDEQGGVEGALCAGCIPAGQEICNGDDDDCDTAVDENLFQDCGTDVGECTAGEEQCIDGVWENCTAILGSNEICDGLDNDCNGTVDGFVQECTEDPDNDPPYDGICQPGFQTCPVPTVPGMGNSFGDCQGEIGPADSESCDLFDNDCDGDVDEDTGGADCSTACGVGTTVCNNGVLECDNGGNMGMPEECNGADDDCDNLVDEGIPSGGDCFDGGLCLPGQLQCIGGQFICTGGQQPGTEICDCLDNDCDEAVDEEPPSLCPSGATCTSCQCAYPCADGEFPCPIGRYCSSDNFCLVDPCYQVTCDPDDQGNATTCVEGECVPVCDTVNCPTGTACRASDGSCQYDDCRGFPERCTDAQFCVAGTCVDDPCDGVSCEGEGQYCYGGNCVESCVGVSCSGTMTCLLGECVDDPCNGTCEDNQVCIGGECQNNPCRGRTCEQGQACNPQTGNCEQDPCLGVDCPGEQDCSGGSCYEPGYNSDAGPEVDHTYVAPGGGGGCSAGGGASLLGALLLLLFFAARRRKEEVR